MTQSLPTGLNDTFLWSEELGRGWHTRPAMRYEGQYFAHYQKLDSTQMGALLTRARLDLVSKYCAPYKTLDIGIGGGRYVLESCGDGYDVCEDAVKWLETMGSYVDPYKQKVSSVTCWDSLEHIPEPEKLLAQVKDWLFVSLPVCDTQTEWLRSKHYKPSEHLFYFSTRGLIEWCASLGFECLEVNKMESNLGREGISTFVLKRVE